VAGKVHLYYEIGPLSSACMASRNESDTARQRGVKRRRGLGGGPGGQGEGGSFSSWRAEEIWGRGPSPQIT